MVWGKSGPAVVRAAAGPAQHSTAHPPPPTKRIVSSAPVCGPEVSMRHSCVGGVSAAAPDDSPTRGGLPQAAARLRRGRLPTAGTSRRGRSRELRASRRVPCPAPGYLPSHVDGTACERVAVRGASLRAAGGMCCWQAQVRSTAVRILTRSHGVDDAQGVVKAPQVKAPQPQPLWQ